MIAFLDASALIYLLEGEPRLARAARQTIRRALEQGSRSGVAMSRLSWLECRVGPLRREDSPTLQRYDAFFAHEDVIWIELTRDVVEIATIVRAEYGLRTPDALQAASCFQLGAEGLLVTGDRDFRAVPGLRVGVIA